MFLLTKKPNLLYFGHSRTPGRREKHGRALFNKRSIGVKDIHEI